jgi:hypothetical protein
MTSNPSTTYQASLRLDEIVKYLKVGKRWQGATSERAVIEACLKKVAPLIEGIEPRGEVLSSKIAKNQQVQFEEVHSEDDINTLEDLYLRGKREMGFALLRDEIYSPNVDALLFQRQNAQQYDHDRWVAVLNMIHTQDRAYWNRFHELAHRLAEPPQLFLAFRRQLTTDLDPVEKLIDAIAGNLAFHPRIFLPYLQGVQQKPLTFEIVEQIRNAYAPTASLLSVTNAVVKKWDRPAVAFIASEKSKKNGPPTEKSLRIEPQARNSLAFDAGLYLIPNMRVPQSSCAFETFLTGITLVNIENTKTWATSSGSRLPEFNVTVSAIRLNERIYGIMTII